MHCKSICLIFLCLIFSSIEIKAQSFTNFIVVDQFGYLSGSKKIAVIRDPHTGFDAEQSFAPGETYALVEASTGETVFSGEIIPWNEGQVDGSSGDKVWHFDFSLISETGSYYVLDVENDLRSFTFDISPAVYNEVLKHAVRTFYYQRAGFPKAVPYADAPWIDDASHLGPLQDTEARLYNDKNNAASERDLHGGWYDAGDYNKYTNWTANYIVDFMKAWLENPGAFGDDYKIPESGNGIPDLLDEAKWGLDFLLRMQQEDGGMLSIVGLAHASPPSAATGQSLYGSASTSASLNSSAAFALASKVYEAIGMGEFAGILKESAIKAWDWAELNPHVIFHNNDQASGTAGLGAGNQETDDYGRLMAKLEAASYLFEITGETKYRDFFETNYEQAHLFEWNFAYPFETANQEIVLYYARLDNVTESVANHILTTYAQAMKTGAENFPAHTHVKDPYFAHLKDYTWGSNSVKALKGLMFTDMLTYNVDPGLNEDAFEAAENYIHYIHGVNPMNRVYLSNMYDYGAENSVNEFYHTWFADGTEWDRVGESAYGPAPAFLTGGPNPSYDWDGCCPDGCGSAQNNAVCASESLTPPKNQPPQKSYKDFNTSWPLNSWSVTENSCGYQINYIRLLSHFADPGYDCSGTKDGTAFIDACGVCAGGTTGIEPQEDPAECDQVTGILSHGFSIEAYPNPGKDVIYFRINENGSSYQIKLTNVLGKLVHSGNVKANFTLDISGYPSGVYLLTIQQNSQVRAIKVVKE